MPQNLIKINNTALPKLKTYDTEYVKLYADAGRNMAGELISTFIGKFIKITLEFAHTTGSEMSLLVGLLNNPTFSVEWFDIETQTMKTQDFYSGDFKPSLLKKSGNGLYDPMSVNII